MSPPHATTAPGGGRTYTHPVNGKTVPSVTTILRMVDSAEGLIQWAANCAAEWAIANRELLGRDDAYDECRTAHKRVRNKAGGRGTDVHAVAERLVRGEGVAEYDRSSLGGYVDALESWFAEYQPTPVHVEAQCWNTKDGYAGSADLICKLKGHRGLTILDWKTSKAFAADAAAQLAAYANSLELTVGNGAPFETPTISHGVVVKLAADGTWEMREADLKAGWELFRAALTVHRLHSLPAVYKAQATKGAASAEQLDEVAAGLRARVAKIVAHGDGAPAMLAARWPAGVATFKNGGPVTLSHCALVEAAVTAVEIEHEVAF